MSYKKLPFGANEQNTKALTKVLFKAFVDYCNQNDIGPADIFMAAHNIHCWMLQSLEKHTEATPEQQLLLRRMAVSTLKESLERRP